MDMLLLVMIGSGLMLYRIIGLYMPNGFQDAARRQGSDKFVGNEFAQPKPALW